MMAVLPGGWHPSEPIVSTNFQQPGFRDAATPPQRRAMRTAIVLQCFGTLSHTAFTSGLILVYLTSLNVVSELVLVLISTRVLIDALCRVPCALVAERIGKKRVGLTGLMLTVLGFSALTLAAFAPVGSRMPAIVAGIVVFAVGESMMVSGWYALLSPIVPVVIRGRFFGRLRVSWQITGVLFMAASAFVLTKDAPLAAYQGVFWLMVAGLVVRTVLYARLPELEQPSESPERFRPAIGRIVRTEGYVSFCAYLFLLALCTMGAPIVFGLIEKHTLGFGDDQVVWMGNLLAIGMVLGFGLGGKAVDRFGTKPVFLLCHFGYGAVLLAFLGRGAAPGPVIVIVGVLNFLYGLVYASASIAITTELLALIPPENKSLSTSLLDGLYRTGGALSGILAGWALGLGMFTESWGLWGMPMTRYDTILLFWGLMVVLLVVALGLVPSVIRKAQWVPRGD